MSFLYLGSICMYIPDIVSRITCDVSIGSPWGLSYCPFSHVMSELWALGGYDIGGINTSLKNGDLVCSVYEASSWCGLWCIIVWICSIQRINTLSQHIIYNQRWRIHIAICDALQKLTLGTNDAMKVLNEFFSRTFNLEIYGTTLPQCPSLHFKAK